MSFHCIKTWQVLHPSGYVVLLFFCFSSLRKPSRKLDFYFLYACPYVSHIFSSINKTHRVHHSIRQYRKLVMYNAFTTSTTTTTTNNNNNKKKKKKKKKNVSCSSEWPLLLTVPSSPFLISTVQLQTFALNIFRGRPNSFRMHISKTVS